MEFTRVRPNIKTILKRILWVFLGSVVLALVYYLIFGMFILSPAERNLVRETQLMQTEYERLTNEMNTLNKVVEELEMRDRSIYGTVLHSTPLEVTREADISITGSCWKTPRLPWPIMPIRCSEVWNTGPLWLQGPCTWPGTRCTECWTV